MRKQLGLIAAAAAAALTFPATGAEAAIVTYSTTGSQLCIGASGCGVASQTIGGGAGLNITFNPVASSSVNADPTTFGSFGELVVSCVGGGTACGSQSLAGLNLFINIAQTAPTAGSGSISGGVIVGTISGIGSSATINWSIPNAINIGPVSYGVLNNPLGLVPPSVNAGVTSIQAIITATPVPETSTWAMMIAGFGLVGSTLRARKTKLHFA
jgi:hypothetical protein